MLAGAISIGTTEIIAAYAAVVATVVLAWDVYKWKASGPRIRFSVSSNMKILQYPGISATATFVNAKAINVGNLPTTITTLAIQHYKSWLLWVLRRPDHRGVILNTALKPLPHILEPGTIWTGLIDQTCIEGFTRSGILFCELYLSHRRRPKTARIRLEKALTEDEPSQNETPRRRANG